MKKALLSIIFAIASLLAIAQDKKQCTATTVKGVQCRMAADSASSFCKIHNPIQSRCGAKTTNGNPCKRRVTKVGEHCTQHQF